MKRGITLLEVLVAASVLSIGLVGALEVVANSANATRQTTDRVGALLFARSKLEEIFKEPTLRTGTDQGQGVDTSTDFDWFADIEPSDNPALVVITVTAKNRVTGFAISLTALRRPDLATAPDGTSTQPAAQDDSTGDAGAAGGGT